MPPKRTARPPSSATTKPSVESRQGVKTPDELEAYVWTLKADDRSWREIAAETGMSVTTVGRILAKDPARLEALVSAQKEERSRIYKRLEHGSLLKLERMIEHVDKTLFPGGRPRRRPLSKAERETLLVARPWAAVLKQVADSSTRHSQLLAGGATDRIESAAAEVADDMTDDQLIHTYIELDMVILLPPELREKAQKLLDDAPDTRVPA